MLEWKLWVDTAESWDYSLLCSEDYSVFQSFGWGEYKGEFGWSPERYYCLDKCGKTRGMAQIFVKKLPLGVAFIWIPGGLVFRFPGSKADELTELIGNLISTLRAIYPRSLIRFYSQEEASPIFSFAVNKICLRPYVKINSGFSVRFKLKQSYLEMIPDMTSKHRYYTKKASASRICWIVGNDDTQLAHLANIHQEMVHEKMIHKIGTTMSELRGMRDKLGDKVYILTGFLMDVPIVSCLVLLFGCKAFYMVACTGKSGREVSASYAMFARLMQELISCGIKDFDFGGLDPMSEGAAGVNHFKCGFGGSVVEHLGEWESSSSEVVKLVINFAIRLKGGRS